MVEDEDAEEEVDADVEDVVVAGAVVVVLPAIVVVVAAVVVVVGSVVVVVALGRTKVKTAVDEANGSSA